VKKKLLLGFFVKLGNKKNIEQNIFEVLESTSLELMLGVRRGVPSNHLYDIF